MVLGILLALPAASGAADDKSGTAVATQTETLVLRVNLNTENKGDLFVRRSSNNDFLVRVEDLKAIGLKDPAGAVQVIEGEPHLSLRSIRGVTATFDEKALALNITAEPQLLAVSSFGLRAERRKGILAESTNSAFLNYALTGTSGGVAPSGLGFAGEAGVRWGDYLFLSDAGTVATTAGKKFVRLMSSVTRDDRENLRRIVFGDLWTPSRDFSNSVNLGGIGITKLYGIDPYFVRFPTQSLTGSVVLPSDMEVYLDGQRIRTERLRPGEFELRDILAYGGARNIQVILRDAFGRVQQLNYSLYFTDQPLQQGLHEYSYNFGAMRRQYGIESNSYGPAAFTMFHRYGVSNAMTLGWRGEVTRGMLNTGPTATVVLGVLGVANLGVTASTIAGKQGTAGLASYNFDSKKWALGVFLRHDSQNYASLGDPPAMTNRRYEGSISATYRLPQNANVSLSYAALTTRTQAGSIATPAQPFTVVALGNRRVSALTYSTPLGSIRTQLTATLSRIKDEFGGRRTEAFLGLNFLLDNNYAAAASYRGDRHSDSESVRLTKNQPIGEGLGYELSLDRANTNIETSNTNLQFRSNIQYNAPAAVLRAEYGQFLDQGIRTHDQRVSVAGGIVAAGGHVAMSRPVTQSYAIVKVGDVPEVGVLLDGQPVGKTDSKGIAVIPSLNAYYENSVSIASGSLPMDYALPAEVKRVAPSLRSGAFIDFGVTKTQAFSGKVMFRRGVVTKAVEFAEIDVIYEGKSQKLPTGRGGEFYVENLKPGSYRATVSIGAERCWFDLNIPKSDEMFVDLGELLCVPVW